jgi:hypothetical protein
MLEKKISTEDHFISKKCRVLNYIFHVHSDIQYAQDLNYKYSILSFRSYVV